MVATFGDDPAIHGKGKYAGWRELIASLDQADHVVVGRVGDLPGRTVNDLLKILDLLREHDVTLRAHREAISTDDGPDAILDFIAAYRAAKLSEGIRRGISRARVAGKLIGRPPLPDHIRRRIETAIADGGGIRPTARRFAVSPASVINIRRMMREPEKLAA